MQLLKGEEMNELYYEKNLNKYNGLIKHMADRYKLDGYEKDDLIQEFRMLLIEALDTFDDTRGAAFKTYFILIVRTWVHHQIVKINAEKRGRLVRTVRPKRSRLVSMPSTDYLEEFLDERSTPDKLEKEMRVVEFVIDCLKEMKYGDYTRKILIEGNTLQGTAKEYNVSFQFVHQEHKKNLKKLRELLIEHEYVKEEGVIY